MSYSKVADEPQAVVPPNGAAAERSEVVVDAAGLSDRGQERSRNEDAFLVAMLQRSLVIQRTNVPDDVRAGLTPDDSALLMVVADGMGGQRGGDLASRLAVVSVSAYIAHYMPWTSPRMAARTPSAS